MSPRRSSPNDRWAMNDEFDKETVKNDFINEERGVNNSIGEESATNNKFDLESITNDKIEEESVRRVRIDEEAVKKTVQRVSAHPEESIRWWNRNSVSPDYQFRCWDIGVWELECRRVKRGRSGQDQISDVVGGNGREIEDANEDCRSSADAIHWQGDGHQTTNSCDHAKVSVSSSSCTENTRGDPTDAVRSGHNEPRKLKDTDTEEESRWGNRDFHGIDRDVRTDDGRVAPRDDELDWEAYGRRGWGNDLGPTFMRWRTRWIRFKKKWRSSRGEASWSHHVMTTRRKSRSSMVRLWRRWWSTTLPPSWAPSTIWRYRQKALARRRQVPCHAHGWDAFGISCWRIVEQSVVVSVPQIRKEIGEETRLIQQVRVAERSVEHRRPPTADPGAAWRSAEG